MNNRLAHAFADEGHVHFGQGAVAFFGVVPIHGAEHEAGPGIFHRMDGRVGPHGAMQHLAGKVPVRSVDLALVPVEGPKWRAGNPGGPLGDERLRIGFMGQAQHQESGRERQRAKCVHHGGWV